MDGRPSETRNVIYREIRDTIADGDIFMFRGAFRSSKGFEWLFKTFYSHAAIAARWGERLMILQAEAKGIQSIPLSVAIGTYPGRADWYRLKREDWPDVDDRLPRVLAEAKSDLGLRYGYLNLAKALWYWISHVSYKDPIHPRGMYCSQYVEHCFREGGMSLTGLPDLVTLPKQIAESRRIEYQATVRHNPDNPGRRDDDEVPPWFRATERGAASRRPS